MELYVNTTFPDYATVFNDFEDSSQRADFFRYLVVLGMLIWATAPLIGAIRNCNLPELVLVSWGEY